MKTNKNYKKSLWSLLLIVLGGCTFGPSYFNQNVQFVPTNWSKIAVLPFTGDIRFTQVAADTFNLHLLGQNDFTILEPSTVEFAINKVIIKDVSPSSFTILDAQKIGEFINAEAVFIGNITSYNDGITLDAFATVKLVDTRSGKIIAVSHKPSGLIAAWSEHQCAMNAVERIAKDMLKVLKDLSKKNTISYPDMQEIKKSPVETQDDIYKI